MGERKVWLTENTGLGWRTADWNVDRDSSGLSVLHNKVNTFIGPLNPTGQHMYRTVVTVCTAQWSPYVPHSGHYMYRTVITIYTAQWSLYVPHSGHYMYRTVVTICTAQWSLYVPYCGHYMYRTVVTIYTASLTFNNSTFCSHSCIYVFCVDLRINRDYFPIQH